MLWLRCIAFVYMSAKVFNRFPVVVLCAPHEIEDIKLILALSLRKLWGSILVSFPTKMKIRNGSTIELSHFVVVRYRHE